LLNSRNNVRVGAAAANVSAHQFANLIGSFRFAFRYQRGGRADLTGCAVAALKRIVVDEGLLELIENSICRQAFNGGDVLGIMHDGQGQARVNTPAIHQYRAGATLTVIATFFCPGKVQVITQRVEQCGPRQNVELPARPVDDQPDRNPIRAARVPFVSLRCCICPCHYVLHPLTQALLSSALRLFVVLFCTPQGTIGGGRSRGYRQFVLFSSMSER
jgi:hypothetical protein